MRPHRPTNVVLREVLSSGAEVWREETTETNVKQALERRYGVQAGTIYRNVHRYGVCRLVTGGKVLMEAV